MQYDTEREKSEREVIAATEVMINERIPALAAELDTVDTTAFCEIYNLSGTPCHSRPLPHEFNPHVRVVRVVRGAW
jgi:hypothetical protein